MSDCVAMKENSPYDDMTFSTEAEIELDSNGLDNIPSDSLVKLEDLGVIKIETERRDGREVITRCSVNMHNLAAIGTEFHVSERRAGERWELGSWNPDVRVLE